MILLGNECKTEKMSLLRKAMMQSLKHMKHAASACFEMNRVGQDISRGFCIWSSTEATFMRKGHIIFKTFYCSRETLTNV